MKINKYFSSLLFLTLIKPKPACRLSRAVYHTLLKINNLRKKDFAKDFKSCKIFMVCRVSRTLAHVVVLFHHFFFFAKSSKYF